MKISMDGKGPYADNIFVERLWRTVKYEEVYLKAYVNAVEARRELGAYFRFGELRCRIWHLATTIQRACIPARLRTTFKPVPATTNVRGAVYSKKTAPKTVGITAHKRQRLAVTSHLSLLWPRIRPMPPADASTSVAMLRKFISAVGRISRETKSPMLTASASAPPATSVNCSKYAMNLVNATRSAQIV